MIRAYSLDKNKIYIYMHDNQHYADFSVEWHELQGELCPKLQAFDDCWYTLFHYGQDLLTAMAEVDKQAISRDNFAKILDRLGFVKN